ncbi:MAG: 3-dehydroquinate synthase [Lachnospiraceae bacterium]|nr:3-dehydroquinate synthase [Lachnospiraceae bacterium]MDD7050692.1 3-dehydroquinate synthase [Lachnospiraceae bacterium]MDY4096129.1 3-dehydroquinate synthase [Lachnospiraceae bacterium]
MSKRLEVLYEKRPCYDIVIERDFDSLGREMARFAPENRRLCIVTDSQVEALYGERIRESLSPVAKEVLLFSFPAGEASKTLDTVRELYCYLIEHRMERKDMLIALGGGVVGDLTGFAAATYLRGIEFIQIPTTLLAQVDSSIGGKTGVDFDLYKNMVGAFKMPRLVYINISVLSTLDDRQFYNGFAEVMKHGLIKNGAYYEWLIGKSDEIDQRDPDILEEMIYQSCRIKKAVVEKDPKEQGERALLNFGHTIGHAIEKEKNFTLQHGECVALGCVAASFISWKRGLLSMEEYYEVRDMFVLFQLPISITGIEASKILELTKSDKKMEQGQIKFVLLKQIGKAIIDPTVKEEEILAGIEEIIYRDEE